MIELIKTAVFERWLTDLRDIRVRARIEARIRRLSCIMKSATSWLVSSAPRSRHWRSHCKLPVWFRSWSDKK